MDTKNDTPTWWRLNVPRLKAMCDMAMTIIANAGSGDWSKESGDWRKAAREWMDEYHSVVFQALRATESPAEIAFRIKRATGESETFIVIDGHIRNAKQFTICNLHPGDTVEALPWPPK